MGAGPETGCRTTSWKQGGERWTGQRIVGSSGQPRLTDIRWAEEERLQ